jgi:hypothetical protein
MILHDFKCAKHGVFEGSHPICPELGCQSIDVIKVFLKAPGMLSASTKRFDAGIRESARNMNLTNFRSAKAGEAAHGGTLGQAVLWGNEAEKISGKPFAALTQQAAAGAKYTHANGTVEHIPDGMRQAAPSVQKNVLAPAQRTVASNDMASKAKA